VIMPARRFVTVSSSPENMFPHTRAKENLFFACWVDTLLKAVSSWPLMSPRTMLGQSQRKSVFKLDVQE
jgi:hypothetical protein